MSTKMEKEFVSKTCKGEPCSVCGKPSTKKVEETIFDDDPNPWRHGLSAYLCDEHFKMIMSHGNE